MKSDSGVVSDTQAKAGGTSTGTMRAYRLLGPRTVSQVGEIGFCSMARDSSIRAPYAGSIAGLCGVVSLAQAGQIQAEMIPIGFISMADTYRLMDEGKTMARAVLVPSPEA